MDNEADAKRQWKCIGFWVGFFSADQYKIEWNKSWKAGFKAGDFYEK